MGKQFPLPTFFTTSLGEVERTVVNKTIPHSLEGDPRNQFQILPIVSRTCGVSSKVSVVVPRVDLESYLGTRKDECPKRVGKFRRRRSFGRVRSGTGTYRTWYWYRYRRQTRSVLTEIKGPETINRHPCMFRRPLEIGGFPFLGDTNFVCPG